MRNDVLGARCGRQVSVRAEVDEKGITVIGRGGARGTHERRGLRLAASRRVRHAVQVGVRETRSGGGPLLGRGTGLVGRRCSLYRAGGRARGAGMSNEGGLIRSGPKADVALESVLGEAAYWRLIVPAATEARVLGELTCTFLAADGAPNNLFEMAKSVMSA